jgi:hypothetical protein
MHHYRRVNEHNVDLNRNALLHYDDDNNNDNANNTNSRSPAQQQHRAATVIRDYDWLSPTFFNPPYAPTLWYYHVQVWMQALYGLLRYGYSSIKRTMVAGQYHQPYGIFYGGASDGMEPSLQHLFQVLHKQGVLPTRTTKEEEEDNEMSSSPSTITADAPPTLTFIDVHTGLGPPGEDTLMFSNRQIKRLQQDEDETSVLLFQKQMERLFAGSLLPNIMMMMMNSKHHRHRAAVVTSSKTSPAAQQVVAGYDLAIGMVTDYIHEQWMRYYYWKDHHHHKTPSLPCRRPATLSLVQEFGTVDSLLVARALIIENMAWRFSHHHQHAQWAQVTTRAAFFPNVPSWRAKVLQHGLRLLYQAQSSYDYDCQQQNNNNNNTMDSSEEQVPVRAEQEQEEQQQEEQEEHQQGEQEQVEQDNPVVAHDDVEEPKFS